MMPLMESASVSPSLVQRKGAQIKQCKTVELVAPPEETNQPLATDAARAVTDKVHGTPTKKLPCVPAELIYSAREYSPNQPAIANGLDVPEYKL
jgi:hypothetical protein